MKRLKSVYVIILLLITYKSVEAQNVNPKNKNIHITGLLTDRTADTGSVELIYYPEWFGDRAKPARTIYKSVLNKDRFKFDIENQQPYAYISLNIENRNINMLYLVEAGTDVQITADGNIIKFSGRSAAIFECQQRMGKVEAVHDQQANLHTVEAKLNHYKLAVDRKLQKQLNILSAYKSRLSKETYDLLSLNAASRSELSSLKYIHELAYLRISSEEEKAAALKYFQQHFKQLKTRPSNESLAVGSEAYTDLVFLHETFLLNRNADKNTEDQEKDHKLYPIGDLFRALDSKYEGRFKEKLLTKSIMMKSVPSPDSIDHYTDVLLARLHTPLYKELVLKQKNSIGKGAQVYDFALQDTTGKMCRLVDLKGKVVVLEFYFTGCIGCAGLARAIKPVVKEFENRRDVVFVSVNLDGTMSSFKKAVNQGIYTHKTSLNLWTNGLKNGHPLVKSLYISGAPALFLIDKEGKLLIGQCPRPVDRLLPSGEIGPSSVTKAFIRIIQDYLMKNPENISKS